eukprot:scaffold86256_cov36-Cyclotella_meneghiniana.AAC.1
MDCCVSTRPLPLMIRSSIEPPSCRALTYLLPLFVASIMIFPPPILRITRPPTSPLTRRLIVVATHEQRHRPSRAPPFREIDPPSSTRTNSIRPDPSSLDGTFLDSNEAQSHEIRRANKEDDVDKALRTYREYVPSDVGRTLSDLPFVHASPTRTSTRPAPSTAFLGSRKAWITQLVYENEDLVEQSFGTYHGFPSGGAESVSRSSCSGRPSSDPMNSALISRQQSRNNIEDDDETVRTYHGTPLIGYAPRDSSGSSRDGSPSSQQAGDSVNITSFSRDVASGECFDDDSDIVRDGRGNGSGFSRCRGHRDPDGCADDVDDGSSSSVGGFSSFRPRSVPRNLSALMLQVTSSGSFALQLHPRPDKRYLLGRLQVDQESFENASRFADYISKYQLSLAKLRERIIQFDLKDSTIIYSNFNVNSSVVSGNSYDLIHDHEKLDFDMVLQWQHWHNLWALDVDIESSNWTTKLLFNSLKPDFHDEVFREFMELPIEHRGSASALLWIVLDRVDCSSFELTQALKNFIHTFQLSSYPDENVHAACLQFKAIFKALYDANDIPSHSATIILNGFATSSDPDFNTVCDNLALEEQLFHHCWTTNDSDLLYDHLTNNILPVLENYYWDHEMAGTWAGDYKTTTSRLVSSDTQGKTSLANIEQLLQEQLATKLAKD